ncbi:MAG: hypothetical protein K2Q07_01075 [Burkholderiaceae bacterium]|nr:hypothetical protein [Burkholderiaceae bacterium]
MPHVRRTADGRIESLYGKAGSATEFVADGDRELLAFVGAAPIEFSQLDAEFVRVPEDVIDTLIIKNILNISDLTDQAQAKLPARKSRSPLSVPNSRTRQWTVAVQGEPKKRKDYGIDDLLRLTPMEERVYRLRPFSAAATLIQSWITSDGTSQRSRYLRCGPSQCDIGSS